MVEVTLEDKVILVTGGAQGLGAAICRELAQAAARVIAADIQEDKAWQTAKQLQTEGLKASASKLDVTDAVSIKECISTIIAKHKKLDAVINNAGTDVTKPIEEMHIAELDRVLAVNLRGPFILCKEAWPHLAKTQGHIINISSTAAKRAWPNAAAYHASKWGLLGLSQALFTEAVKQGIKVTAVIAGGMRTPFILARFPDVDPENLQEPARVARVVKLVLEQPADSAIPEVMVVPLKETSWP